MTPNLNSQVDEVEKIPLRELYLSPAQLTSIYHSRLMYKFARFGKLVVRRMPGGKLDEKVLLREIAQKIPAKI